LSLFGIGGISSSGSKFRVVVFVRVLVRFGRGVSIGSTSTGQNSDQIGNVHVLLVIVSFLGFAGLGAVLEKQDVVDVGLGSAISLAHCKLDEIPL
jgi:hypothetical protein